MASEPIQNTISRIVRRERVRRKMTLDALAAAAGVSKTYVWDIENHRRNVTCSMLLRLSKALGFRPEKVFTEHRAAIAKAEGRTE